MDFGVRDSDPSNNALDPPLIEKPLNGPQTSDLLARLPPIKQTTIEGSTDLPQVVGLAGNASRHQSIREHGREISLRKDEECHDLSDRLDFPRRASQPKDRVPQRPRTSSVSNKPSPSVPGTPMTTSSQRAASLSRVITALSEISSKSSGSRFRIPPLNPSTNYERLDDSDGEPQAPRSTWVQNLLGRSSTAAGREMPTMTARPSQLREHEGRTNTMPLLHRISAVSDENVPHDEANFAESVKDLEFRRKHNQNEESFARAIVNLESLLQEALSIAHQAAGNGENGNDSSRRHDAAPGALDDSLNVNPPPVLSSPVAGSDDDHIDATPKQIVSTDDHTDEGTHRPKQDTKGIFHQSDVVIVEPPNEEQNRGHFKKARDATPYPGVTRNASIIPPTNGEPAAKQPSAHGQLLLVPGQSSAEPSLARVQTISKDWALVKRQPTIRDDGPGKIPSLPRQPTAIQAPLKKQHTFLDRNSKPLSAGLANQQRPPLRSRRHSTHLRIEQDHEGSTEAYEMEKIGSFSSDFEQYNFKSDLEDGEGTRYNSKRPPRSLSESKSPDIEMDKRRESTVSPLPETRFDLQDQGPIKQGSIRKGRRSHFSIKEPHGFSLSRSHRRAPIARDWSTSRKRWTAVIACLSTALIGLIIGIYAGEVPAIQYAIVDEHHYTILGNVVFFIGLAITTSLFFPLPLLHGRKPYTLAALAILMPLQFPQALSVNQQRTPTVATYRVGILLSRTVAGLVMGFANINFLATLLDLFGASLQSSNPHQEMVDVNDVRRHGGGMGMWLGIWTWCFIGSIGVGFFIGAVIISGLDVSWGFWITIIFTAAVLILNVLAPEVRRSTYRRSLAEVRNGGEVSHRIARGEMKMHLDATGPIYWWEEITAGLRLCGRMLKQPGFVVLSFYLGWIYGQIVMVIVVSGCVKSQGEAHLLTVAGRIDFQVLSLSPAICWTVRRGHSNWRFALNTVPKGISAKSCKDAQAKNR